MRDTKENVFFFFKSINNKSEGARIILLYTGTFFPIEFTAPSRL